MQNKPGPRDKKSPNPLPLNNTDRNEHDSGSDSVDNAINMREYPEENIQIKRENSDWDNSPAITRRKEDTEEEENKEKKDLPTSDAHLNIKDIKQAHDYKLKDNHKEEFQKNKNN